MVLLQPELRGIFDEFDHNYDGRIDLDELRSILKLVGIDASQEELEKVVGAVSLDLKEFVVLCQEAAEEGYGESGELMEAFKVFNEDGDGFILGDELRRELLRTGLWTEGNGNCMMMICRFDANSDGRLDFQEFKDMILFKSQYIPKEKKYF